MILKNSLLKIIISFVLVSSLGFLFSACHCGACAQKQETEVPLEILQKANSYISAQTGREFFEKYIAPDFVKTKKVGSTYQMAYRFYMPEKPFVDETISFFVDSTGSVMNNRDITGIPQCLNNPQDCEFKIDKVRAENIAKDTGLEPGIKDWKIGFIWSDKLKQYVWHVLATFHETKGGTNGYMADGKEVVIDPNSGLVLENNEWHIR